MSSRAPLAVVVVLFVVDFALMFGLNMARPLDHDEHQFVAAAAVYSREGLRPYVDFPYFHAPYLVYVQALVFRFTDYLLLSSRLLSVLAAWAAHALIFVAALRAVRGTLPRREGVLFASGGVLLLLFNPLAQHTSGRAWNHDAGLLPALAGFLLLVACVSTDHRQVHRPLSRVVALFASGALLGIAAGVRLTFLPLAAGVGLIVLADAWRQRHAAPLAGFAAGIAVTLSPMAYSFARAPAGFVFGNLQYPAVNTAYRQLTGHERAMTVAGKVWFFFEVALGKPGTILLALALACLWWAHRRARGRAVDAHDLVADGDTGEGRPTGRGLSVEHSLSFTGGFSAVQLVLLSLPFLLLGAVAPTPSWAHYYYALVPFMVVGVMYGFAGRFAEAEPMRGRALAADPANAAAAQRRPLAFFGSVARGGALTYFGAMVLVTVVFGLSGFREARSLARPTEWFTVVSHRMGVDIAQRTGPGPVLTLAPLYPLEGGGAIYPQLVTSPFVWRTASLVDESTRSAVGIISEDELPRLLEAVPPAAVLVGYEPDAEAPFIAFATAHGYTPIELANGTALWTPAAPLADGGPATRR